jgi:hypothetical protein
MQTSLQEIIRLPLLYSHFIEHKEHNANLDFVEFLTIHYSSTEKPDSDAEKDNNLPFKNIDIDVFQSVYTSVGTVEITHKSVLPLNSNHGVIPKQKPINPVVQSIFQPPRFS